MLTDSTTGRCLNTIEITPEMIAAGVEELIIDAGSVPSFVVFDILTSALEAGGFEVHESAKST